MFPEPVNSVYEELHTFDDATARFCGLPRDKQRDSPQELRALVMRYVLAQIVGVDIKHRHFTMGPGQVLLEKQDMQATGSVMRASPASESMVPFSFVLLSDWLASGCLTSSLRALASLPKLA